MLHNVKELNGFAVHASDGEIGTVKDIYFDDRRWALRYIIVDTGSWLIDRKVLISPISVRDIVWADEILHVDLTKAQVKDSPDIDTDKPVSRQHEIGYYDYYGYPNYWQGASLWGSSMYPMSPWIGPSLGATFASMRPHQDIATRDMKTGSSGQDESSDSQLRSAKEVIGYDIMAQDGLIGVVENFLFDEKSWAIHYMGIDTHKWLPGKHVLLPLEWIDRVDWEEGQVFVNVVREAVKTSPEYDESQPLSREQEESIYAHHEHQDHRP